MVADARWCLLFDFVGKSTDQFVISKSISDQRLVTSMSEFNQSAVVHSSVVASVSIDTPS